jgi:hypothetical protein
MSPTIGPDALVSGSARVSDSAWVYDSARVSGSARVYDSARVSDSAWVSGAARVYDSAWVSDSAWVYGSAQVYDSARVSGSAQVSGSGDIADQRHIAWVDMVGTGGSMTLHRIRRGGGYGWRINAGCRWWEADSVAGVCDMVRANVADPMTVDEWERSDQSAVWAEQVRAALIYLEAMVAS